MSGGRDPRVQFRAPEDLVNRALRFIDAQDISKSEGYRTLIRRGLTTIEDGDLSHVRYVEGLDQIRRETFAQKRAAWYRSNVGGRLLKCYNNGLSPDEATDDLAGFRREATELIESDALADYLDRGLEVYAEAYRANSSGLLKDWVKSRDAGRVPDEVPADARTAPGAEVTDDFPGATPDDVGGDIPPDAKVLADELDHDEPERTYPEAVGQAAGLVESGDRFGVDDLHAPTGYEHVDAETFRDDVRAYVDGLDVVDRGDDDGEGAE